MALTDMMGNPQERLVAREGMVVDVSTWNASHDYHALHHLRHNVSLHSPGVIAGLEVVAWDPPDNSGEWDLARSSHDLGWSSHGACRAVYVDAGCDPS